MQFFQQNCISDCQKLGFDSQTHFDDPKCYVCILPLAFCRPKRFFGATKNTFLYKQGLFSGEILRDLLIFLPAVSLKLALWEKTFTLKCNLARIVLRFIIENAYWLSEIFSPLVF